MRLNTLKQFLIQIQKRGRGRKSEKRLPLEAVGNFSIKSRCRREAAREQCHQVVESGIATATPGSRHNWSDLGLS